MGTVGGLASPHQSRLSDVHGRSHGSLQKGGSGFASHPIESGGIAGWISVDDGLFIGVVARVNFNRGWERDINVLIFKGS